MVAAAAMVMVVGGCNGNGGGFVCVRENFVKYLFDFPNFIFR
jgi:hypothetical protein